MNNKLIKNKTEINATIKGPVGKLKTNERIIPKTTPIKPTRKEKINVCLISLAIFTAVAGGITTSAETRMIPTILVERSTTKDPKFIKT